MLYTIIICSFVGCDSPNKQKLQYETLAFNVDHILLEPVFVDTELKITMAAPRNWKMMDKSTLDQIVKKLDIQYIQGLQIVPRWIFFNEDSHATCIVSKLNGVDIVLDENVFQDLVTVYQNKFSKAKVRKAVFLKDGFRVHQLMVTTADFVLIKLICDAPETLVFEVDYHIPKDVYELELKAVESSIGSIDLINRGVMDLR